MFIFDAMDSGTIFSQYPLVLWFEAYLLQVYPPNWNALFSDIKVSLLEKNADTP